MAQRHGVIVALYFGNDAPELDVGAFASISRYPTFEFANTDELIWRAGCQVGSWIFAFGAL
jgi:hypothetical protein